MGKSTHQCVIVNMQICLLGNCDNNSSEMMSVNLVKFVLSSSRPERLDIDLRKSFFLTSRIFNLFINTHLLTLNTACSVCYSIQVFVMKSEYY